MFVDDMAKPFTLNWISNDNCEIRYNGEDSGFSGFRLQPRTMQSVMNLANSAYEAGYQQGMNEGLKALELLQQNQEPEKLTKAQFIASKKTENDSTQNLS